MNNAFMFMAGFGAAVLIGIILVYIEEKDNER